MTAEVHGELPGHLCNSLGGPMTVTVAQVAIVLVSVVACVYDGRFRRIPNWLTLGAAAGALAFFLVTGGLRGAGASLAGWAIAAALFFPFFALGGLGAGDVKLVAALGAWFGLRDALWLSAYAAIAGGGAALVMALARGYLATMVKNLWLLLMHWRVFGVEPVGDMTLETGRGPRLAYAFPIALGALATLWLK
jgi:prepilin peptidase CpaA